MNGRARGSYRCGSPTTLEESVRSVALLLAGLSLCGCAGASVISHSYYSSAYTPDHVRLAAASGTAIAAIRNNPFPQDSGNAGVLAAMQGRNFGPRMYFSQTPRPGDKYGYKVILDFRPPGPSAAYQCQGESTPAATSPSPGPIDVTATFCVGDRLLTDAAGTVSGATGPDDPRFRQLIGDIMVALTPPYDPSRGSCSGPDC
jgi:hypothetical protein